MILFKFKAKRQNALYNILFRLEDMEQPSYDEALSIVVELVKTIRPAKLRKSIAEKQLTLLTSYLKKYEHIRENFKVCISLLVKNTELTEVIVDCGLADEGSFTGELWKRMKHKLLPPLQNTGSFIYVINSIFYKTSDHKWVSGISDSAWSDFFEQLDIVINLGDKNIYSQLAMALQMLSNRVAVLGVDKSIINKLGESKKSYNVFVEQRQHLTPVYELMVDVASPKASKEQLEKLLECLKSCKLEIEEARKKALTQGVGIKETYTFIQLNLLLDRMILVIDLIDGDDLLNMDSFVGYFKSVVEYEKTKNKLRAYIGQTMELLAYRIAEHERCTGEHYITTNQSEYKAMMKSAAGGGLIISFIAVLKHILHSLHLAPFWQGLVYSINYSLGFLVIQATGSTLATKQPAMTASSIAQTLDGKRGTDKNMAKLAITVSKVMRSQTASFIGNLAVAFPVTFILAVAFHLIFGFKMADGAAAQDLLDQQNPLKSLALLYACYTGVFLFLSGLISGYFDNKSVYRKIPERLKAHHILKHIVPKKFLNKAADYIGKNLGMLLGNISLGFFLGFAPFIGYIFGIPFDIRHITISTANFAIGLYGLGTSVTSASVIWTTIGVLLIGFLNFLVSFTLAFFVAIRSRGIKLRHYPRLLKYQRILLFRYPLDYIRPPKKERTINDILDKK